MFGSLVLFALLLKQTYKQTNKRNGSAFHQKMGQLISGNQRNKPVSTNITRVLQTLAGELDLTELCNVQLSNNYHGIRAFLTKVVRNLSTTIIKSWGFFY